MDEMSWKVQNASSHPLRRQSNEHVHNSRSVQRAVQGAMDANVQGKFKLQAHLSSGIVMDIAAFKVSHSVVIDKDATALRAAKERSSSIHRGDE